MRFTVAVANETVPSLISFCIQLARVTEQKEGLEKEAKKRKDVISTKDKALHVRHVHSNKFVEEACVYYCCIIPISCMNSSYCLQTTQSGAVASHKELKRVKEDNKNLEKTVHQTRADLDGVHKQLQREKTKVHELTEQCSQVVSKSKASERVRARADCVTSFTTIVKYSLCRYCIVLNKLNHDFCVNV